MVYRVDSKSSRLLKCNHIQNISIINDYVNPEKSNLSRNVCNRRLYRAFQNIIIPSNIILGCKIT